METVAQTIPAHPRSHAPMVFFVPLGSRSFVKASPKPRFDMALQFQKFSATKNRKLIFNSYLTIVFLTKDRFVE
jgi:hypothetical protein